MSWEEYTEWSCGAEMCKLSHPLLPTFPSGKAIGGFLHLPGSQVLEGLLPATKEDDPEGGAERDLEEFNPAATQPKVGTFAHHLAYPGFPFSVSVNSPSNAN